jgi:hypothetical protein
MQPLRLRVCTSTPLSRYGHSSTRGIELGRKGHWPAQGDAQKLVHAKWVGVTDADITSDGRALVLHFRRMLRFNAVQLWQNLIRQGWKRAPPQW